MAARLPTDRHLMGVLDTIGNAVDSVGNAIGGLFGGNNNDAPPAPPPPYDPNYVRPINAYNPVTATTAHVLQYARRDITGKQPEATVPLVLPGGGNGTVEIFQPYEGDLVLVFSSREGESLDSSESKAVPHLQRFVYTATGPAPLLDAFSSLLSQSGAADGDGPLADAVGVVTQNWTGNMRRVVCTGADTPGQELAVLCGPWAALRYPTANVVVATFGDAWSDAYNPPFSWAWQQLVTLYYLWPFELAGIQPNATSGDTLLDMAQAVNGLITADSLSQALQVPNLPDSPPPPAQSWSPGDPLGALGPELDLPEEYMLPESDCPLIICKSREALELSCLGFGKGAQAGLNVFEELPYTIISDPNTDGDAAVAWNATSSTLYLLFKYTESRQDWLINAQVFQTEAFPESIEPYTPTPPGDRLSDLVPNVQVHSGFYKQFSGLAVTAVEGADNGCIPDVPLSPLLQAVCNLTGGEQPLRVTSSGFSLGAALSELAGVWAAQIWPGADIFVVNQGAPIPGDSNFAQLARACFGRAYRFVYRLDEVPSIPPLPGYQQVDLGVWITDLDTGGTGIMLEDRPPTNIFETTWNDHTCDVYTVPDTGEVIVGYVPQLYNATRALVPAWVYNATAAS